MSDFTPNDPSSTSTGTINEITADTGKVTVEVNVFGRPTLADVNFAQIKLLVLRSGWAA
jgi:transcription antitermination factor NusG